MNLKLAQFGDPTTIQATWTVPSSESGDSVVSAEHGILYCFIF